MSSYLTRNKVAELIETTASAEIHAEILRQVLCDQPMFEPYVVFKRISRLASSITPQRLLAFLAENDVNIGKHEAFYLVKLFDANGDGKLSFTEFLDVVLPKTDLELRKEVNTRKTYPIGQDEGLPYKIEHAVSRLFEQELQAYNECEAIRQELLLCRDFTIVAAFQEVDTKNWGYADADQIKEFMDNAGRPITTQQLDSFMLRVDKHNDGHIRYSKFLELLHSSEVSADREETRGSMSSEQQDYEVSHEYIPVDKQPSSAKLRSPVESLASPHSTKASFNGDSAHKTPTKKMSARYLSDEILEDELEEYNNESQRSSRRESPMKPKEELELVRGLHEMVEHIRKLEVVKNELAVKKDFNLYNAFAIFDTERKGFVTARQLERGFQSLKVQCSRSELDLLIKRLDLDLDGLVKFADFSYALTPKANEFAKLLVAREPYYMREQETAIEIFDEKTLTALRKLFVFLVEDEKLCEAIRQRLVKRKHFNLQDAFKSLDRYDNGFVTAEEFQELLSENGILVSQKDAKMLVERYSKSTKGEISYYDFIREMTPRSRTKRLINHN